MTVQRHARPNRTTLLLRVRPNRPAEQPPQVPARRSRRGFAALGLVAALTGLLTLGVLPRLKQRAELDAAEAEARTALRRVNVVSVEAGGAAAERTLPATVRPFQAAEIHPRVAGYLKRWTADIGSPVRAGEMLAEIDAPELDQETRRAEAALEQARAEVEQSKAELDEAKAAVTAAESAVTQAEARLAYSASVRDRYRQLAAKRSVGQQEFDEAIREHDVRKSELDSAKAELARRRTNLGTREAIIRSKEAAAGSRAADLGRLKELQGFKTVAAPFDGVVTLRNAEVGQLVSAGGEGGRPLFRVTQAKTLRVRAEVPQTFAAPIRVGDEGVVRLPDHPGRTFPAKVARTARSVDAEARTLPVELELPNPDGQFLPGAFAEVTFRSSGPGGPVLVPANAVQTRSGGDFVAVVGDGGRVQVRKVRLGRDHGPRVEVAEGLAGRERLVLNPPDDLRDGEAVEPANLPATSVAAK